MRGRARRRYRIAIAILAVAAPLAGAGSAQAAMAGANPATTGLLPDLRSAKITNVNADTGASTVQVCFDKPIASTPDHSEFFLGNYRQDEVASDNVVRDSNQKCANATWSSSDVDVTQRTYIRIGSPRAGRD